MGEEKRHRSKKGRTGKFGVGGDLAGRPGTGGSCL
jgi:hypothetical protein